MFALPLSADLAVGPHDKDKVREMVEVNPSSIDANSSQLQS
jgi:hypothetical protein